jgi:hypothetical protein
MFIGHFGLGLAAKRATPTVSLGALFAAAQFADLLWPTLVLAGIEQVRVQPGITAVTPLDFVSYPYSHSLLMLGVWGAAFGGMYLALRHGRPMVAFVLALLVVSHWVLDVIVHRPDMPLFPGGPKFGLGLWNSIPATLAVEVPMFLAGVWIYTRVTHPRDRIGKPAAAFGEGAVDRRDYRRWPVYALELVGRQPSRCCLAVPGGWPRPPSSRRSSRSTRRQWRRRGARR